jgi:hypothetical protein
MAARLIACRHRTSGAEQALSDRALAYGYFPDWEPIDEADAAHVAALRPPPAEPEPAEPPAAPEPAVEPSEVPATARTRKAASGHDNKNEE